MVAKKIQTFKWVTKFPLVLSALLGAFFASQTWAQTPLPVVSGVVAGDTPGGFEVSALGAATYSIPLRLPPGTAGVAPQLDRWPLVYPWSVPTCSLPYYRRHCSAPTSLIYYRNSRIPI